MMSRFSLHILIIPYLPVHKHIEYYISNIIIAFNGSRSISESNFPQNDIYKLPTIHSHIEAKPSKKTISGHCL